MENEALFLSILEEELIPAMGCTEPIALAYAAARGSELLLGPPSSIVARCSGNIIKNVRCVSIPDSGGMIGIEAAVVLGAFGGKHQLGMEVLEAVSSDDRRVTQMFLNDGNCRVEYLDSDIGDICSVVRTEKEDKV